MYHALFLWRVRNKYTKRQSKVMESIQVMFVVCVNQYVHTHFLYNQDFFSVGMVWYTLWNEMMREYEKKWTYVYGVKEMFLPTSKSISCSCWNRQCLRSVFFCSSSVCRINTYTIEIKWQISYKSIYNSMVRSNSEYC